MLATAVRLDTSVRYLIRRDCGWALNGMISYAASIMVSKMASHISSACKRLGLSISPCAPFVYALPRVPGAGSFIRPSAKVSLGTSFLQALSFKYIESLHGSGSQETVVLGSSNRSIQVEAVGLDKIRQKLSDLNRLREVSLENVSCSDHPGDILKTCPRE